MKSNLLVIKDFTLLTISTFLATLLVICWTCSSHCIGIRLYTPKILDMGGRVDAVCQVMARGIFAFYAAHMPNTLNTIKSYSSTFRMPFVTSGMAVNSSRQEVAYELYVRPQYSRALRDIIVKKGWNEIWYIYSSNEGLASIQLSLSSQRR